MGVVEHYIKVVEEALPVNLIDKYCDFILRQQNVKYELSQPNMADTNIVFSHTCEPKCSKNHGLFKEVAQEIKKLLPEDAGDLLRVRHAVSTMVPKARIHAKHIDTGFPHYVCLLYLLDSDGNTVLYQPDSNLVLTEVQPKKNRLLIFDGALYHSSSPPSKHEHRIIGNYNFLRNAND